MDRQGEQEATRRALHLLRSFHAGRRRLYVSAQARLEQRLDRPLTEGDRELAGSLLGLPDDREADEAWIASMGAQAAVHALNRLLSIPKPPQYVTLRLFPYLEQRIDEVAWLVESVEVGETGLIIHSAIWTSWEVGSSRAGLLENSREAEREPDPRQWWTRFRTVADDVGTRYQWHGGRGGLPGPVIVTTEAHATVRVSQQYREVWIPGPPRNAQKLLLTPDPKLTVDVRPYGLDAVREIWFDEVTYAVALSPDDR